MWLTVPDDRATRAIRGRPGRWLWLWLSGQSLVFLLPAVVGVLFKLMVTGGAPGSAAPAGAGVPRDDRENLAWGSTGLRILPPPGYLTSFALIPAGRALEQMMAFPRKRLVKHCTMRFRGNAMGATAVP